MQKLQNYISFLKKINVREFFYLNYICKNVIRTDNSKIIPYKNAVIEINPGAKIYVGGGDIELGCDLVKKSKAETRVRLREHAIWSSNGGCKVSYGSTIELLESALFDTGYFTMNSNSTLVSAKKIVFGQDVMISRNVVLYDSDFHSLMNELGEVRNHSKDVVVGNHVWISANVMVLKGTQIHDGSVIGANAIVHERVPENVIYHTMSENKYGEIKGGWSREKP